MPFNQADTLVSNKGSSFGENDVAVQPRLYQGIADPNEVDKISGDVLKLSSDSGVPIPDIEDNYMGISALPEDSRLSQLFQKYIRDPITEHTGLFPYVTDFGDPRRSELSVGERMSELKTQIPAALLHVGAEAVSGRGLSAPDVIAQEFDRRILDSDKPVTSLSELIGKITSLQDKGEFERAAEITGQFSKFVGGMKTMKKILGPMMNRLPVRLSLKTMLSAGVQFGGVSATEEVGDAITEGKDINWERIRKDAGWGVLFGGAESLVGKMLRYRDVNEVLKYEPRLKQIDKGLLLKVTEAGNARAQGMSKKAWLKVYGNDMKKFVDEIRVIGETPLLADGTVKPVVEPTVKPVETKVKPVVEKAAVKPTPKPIAQPTPSGAVEGKVNLPKTKVTSEFAHPNIEEPEGVLTVHHGSPSGKIERFDTSLSGENTGAKSAKLGIFFTNDFEVAAQFSGKPKTDLSKVTDVQLDLQNPLIISTEAFDKGGDAWDKLTDWIVEDARDGGRVTVDGWEDVTEEQIESYVAGLKQRGVDGIILKETSVDAEENGHTMFIAFDASQVHSATDIDVGTKPQVVTGKEVNRQAQPTPTAEPLKTKVPEQEPKLGKEGGATTIIPDIVTEATEVSRRLGATSGEVAAASKELFSRNVKRYTTHLKSLGNTGKSVAKDFDEITIRSQKKINNSSLDTKEILKGVNKENRELIAKAINGRLKNPPKWIKERANKLRKVLDEIMNDAQKLGIQRLVRGVKLDIKGSGKAFPQVPNAEGERMLKLADTKGLGVPEVLQVALDAVEAGKATTVENYLIQLKEFRQAQLRGISGYLERTRVELPEEWIEWDPDRVLSGLFQKNWTFIEGARQWGIDDKGRSFPSLTLKSETIRTEHGSDETQTLDRFVKAAFGQELLSSEASRNVAGAIRGYQFLAKIALSPLTITRNMLDRFNKVAAWAPLSVQAKTFVQYPPFLNTFLKHSQQLEEQMIRRGAIFSNTAIAEGYQPGHLVTSLAGKAFSSSELGNQVYIALAKKNAIDNNLKLLHKNPKIAAIFNKRIGKFLSPMETIGTAPTQAAVRLRELGNEELLNKLVTSDDISPDLLNAVLHRTVRDNAFPVVLSTKRAWWDNHPWARVATQFKVWGTDQVGHVWNDVVKDTVKNRDPSKMVRWLVTMAVMGEVYNILRDFILGKDESLAKTMSDSERRNARDISITILKDMADGGAIGIMADMIYGIPNLIGGPTLATIKNLGTDFVQTIWNPSQAKEALKQFALKDTPAIKQVRGILNKIDAQYNKKNLTQSYYKVRRKAFEWSFNKKHPTTTEKFQSKAVDAVLGWVTRVPTKTTLGYEMMNRNVMSGDIEGASGHVFFLLKTAGKDEEKIASIEQGIKSSLNNSSPLGRVADKDIGAFFNGISKEARKEALGIQLKWDSNASEALQLGINKWQKWIKEEN